MQKSNVKLNANLFDDTLRLPILNFTNDSVLIIQNGNRELPVPTT